METGDRLELCGLEVACIIGDRPEERLSEQRLAVDVSLTLDLSAAAESDSLDNTVDYAALSEAIRAALRKARCHMIERAAALVADVCLADLRVSSVRVRIEKPSVIDGLRAAAVMMERGRERTTNAQRSTFNAQVPTSDLRLSDEAASDTEGVS